MSLSHHHQNQLHLIQAGLLRSDPQLAARLSMFGRLSAGQAMPAWEQLSSRHDRIRQAAALTAQTISVAAAAIVLLLRAVLALAADEHRHHPVNVCPSARSGRRLLVGALPSSDVWSARPDCTGLFHRPAQTSPGPLGHPVLLAPAASPVNVRRDAK